MSRIESREAQKRKSARFERGLSRQFVLALLVPTILIGSLAAQSPPVPSPTVVGQNQEQYQAGEEHNGTETRSPIVSPEARYESAKGQTGHESTQNWVGFLAWVVAAAAVAQFWAMVMQAQYMRRGLRVTAVAADAAKKSGDAATQAVSTLRATERAIVLIENVETTMSTPASGLDVASVVIFTLKNFGRTIANNVELTGALTGIGNLPIETLPPTTIAPQGNNSWATPSISHLAIKDVIQKINQGTGRLEYKIAVTYADTFDTYRYHCEGRYEPALKRFLITASTTD